MEGSDSDPIGHDMKDNANGKTEFVAFLIFHGMNQEEADAIADQLELDILSIEMETKLGIRGNRRNQGCSEN